MIEIQTANTVSDSATVTSGDTFDHDRLVDLETIAKLLGVCGRTIHRLVAAGELPPPAKVGRASRWFLSDVDAYMEKLRKERNTHYTARTVAA